MPEHTIPGDLLEDIRNGRVALVVGAGIGFPSWKQVLERINDDLRQRGRDGDEAAARDVDKLLHKGSLVRAAGFLARTLGADACDRHITAMWSSADGELPDVARALARLPFKQVWTTFPGDALERAMADESPEGWPAPRVVTYRDAGSFDRRRRSLLKVLGDFESFVVTPTSLRKAFAEATELRDLVKKQYLEGALLLVGFRFGDPDLSALLDRLFGSLPPPDSHHYLVASGVGPVTIEELEAEHHIHVVNLEGRGADEKATAALIEFLSALREQCESAGVSLAQRRPDDDDLEGWLAILAEEPEDNEALGAVITIEAAARDAGDAERLIEVLMARAELEPTPAQRASMLRQVAEVFENKIGDLPRAFTALTAALREHPSDTDAVEAAERLADAAEGWTELVADVAQVAADITDKKVAAIYFTKLGSWYHQKLSHPDYALAAYREAIKRDPSSAAFAGVAAVCRSQQRWAELVDALAAQVELELSPDRRVDIYLEMGELFENQLGSTLKASDAYQAAADVDDSNDDALAALERLYRRGEAWGKLAKVLERRAELLDAAGETQRASVLRRELATLRVEKLGDLEGAIAKYEAQLEVDAYDITVLRALEDLYEKVGRHAEYLATLERLAEILPAAEKPAMLRRLAVELEDRDGGRDRAVEAYLHLLDLEPQAEDAFRALERMYKSEGRWNDLVEISARHVTVVKAPAPRADLWATIANTYEKQLGDPDRAIDAHLNALAAVEDHRDSIAALGRLYQGNQSWQRAADALVQLAKLAGDAGADHWAQAGCIAAERLDDPDLAEKQFEKALELSAAHLGALRGLARLHQSRGAWANAAKRLADAEQASTNRLERIELLCEAAELCDKHLDDADRALGLYLHVLELDPEHELAGTRAAQRLMALDRHEQALPILESLARKTGSGAGAETARREAQVADVCRKLGMRQKAMKHYRAAAQAAPEDAVVARGLAATLFEEAEAVGSRERWDETYKAARELLTRHRMQLDDDQMADTWFMIGRAARAMDDVAKAEDAFRRSLEIRPTAVPVLEALVEACTSRGDWRQVVDAKKKLAAAVGEARQVELYEEIGDIAAGKLGDRSAALDAYKRAIAIRPDAHQILHKTLDIHSETRNWKQAIEMLNAIASTASDAKRKAKYFYAAAVIGRDELGDPDVAIDHFQKALEEDPDLPKAFEALDELLTHKQDWRGVARLYRKLLKRLGEHAPVTRQLQLWGRLGDICLEHLDDSESAITAYEVALSLAPADMARQEQLADLYLEAGPAKRQDAIEALQRLIQHFPERVELYRALSNLYLDENELDKAYCLAQALVFLGAADDRERALYERLKPRQFQVAKRKLTEELWQKSIIHRNEDRHLNAIFSSVVGSIAATTAQPPGAFNISRADDPERDARTVSKVFKYASNVLALENEPRLFVEPASSEGVRVANTADKGKLVPTVVVGNPHAEKTNEYELAFEVGKRLAYLRPERYVNYALGTLPKLENAYHAALAAAGAKNAPDSLEGEVGRLTDHLRKTVPTAVLEQVGVVADRMNVPPGNGTVAGWRTATDLTANRVGLILCNDLEIAARAVATEPVTMSNLPAKDRLRDLIAYAVSEEYFAVRRHLGISVQV